MKFDYEFVRYQTGLPIKAYFVNIGLVDYHWHSDLEIMWVLKGSVCVKAKTCEYTLQKDDVFIINPFEVHSLKTLEGDNLLLGIQIDVNTLNDFPFALNGINFFNPYLEWSEHESNKLYKIMTDIMNTLKNKSPETLLYTMSKLYMLLSVLMKNEDYHFIDNSNYRTKLKDVGRLKDIVSYINDHYYEKISLDQIAELCHISKYRASHYIKDKLGISFQQVVNHIRMKYAFEQIVNTQKTVIKIAQDCGFSEVKYLTAVIKKEFGLTPFKLRQCYNLNNINNISIDKDGHRPFDIEEGFELLKIKERV